MLNQDIQQCNDPEQILKKTQKLSSMVSKIREGGEYLRTVISQLQRNLQINLKEVNVQYFLQKIVEQQKPLLFNTKVLFEFNEVLNIYLDVVLITQIIEFYIQTGVEHTAHSIIVIKVEDTEIQYDLSFTKKIKATRDAIKFTIIFKNVKIESQIINTLLSELNDINSNFYQIIFAHFGKCNLYITEEQELCYSLTIPKELNKIRATKLNLPDDNLEQMMSMYYSLEETIKQIKTDIAKKLLEQGIDNYIISKSTGLSIEEVISTMSTPVEK